MKRKFTIKIKKDGTIEIPAYCLRTDSWYDYKAFVDDAKQAVLAGEFRKGNRFLRAALTCLFSHIEGVVREIDALKTIPKVHRGNRLCDLTRNVGHEAKKSGHVPFAIFRLEKHLRDLIAHPGITIAFSDGHKAEEDLDQTSVFEHLDIQTLKQLETRISPWLDAVCRNLKVPRFTDTKQQCEELAARIFGDSLRNSKTHEV